jgi:hypothetical protein
MYSLVASLRFSSIRSKAPALSPTKFGCSVGYRLHPARTLCSTHFAQVCAALIGVDVLVPVSPITKVSGSIFQPLIFSVACDPIECLLGKRASTVRSSPGNNE